MEAENAILELAKGAGLLLAISYLVSWNYQKEYKSEYVRELFNGFYFGIAAVIGMMAPLHLSEGIIFDARTVVLGVGCALGGPITAATATLISLLYRLHIGGTGVLIGSLSIVFSSFIGVLFWHYRKTTNFKINIINTLILGLLIHFINIILFLFLPIPSIEMLLNIGLPMLLVFSPATAILYKMLHTELQWKEDKLDKIHVIQQRDDALRSYTDALVQMINAIARTIESRDPYTAGHQVNVAMLAVEIAKKLEWNDDRIKGLALGASIHDLGKIHIPAEILNRPGKLSEAEFDLIKTHSSIGAEIIKGIDFPWPVKKMVEQHHERIDGTGYPNKLKNHEIIDEAKIIAVADVVEAITSHRPYRPALGLNVGIEEIKRGKGIVYDEKIVDACISVLESGDFIFQTHGGN